jgi:glycosyltransferase involved in cell wall biosynthesis
MSMTKIAHLTSVHTPFDTRIFHKECKTLVKAGYAVVLIVPHDCDETVDGVRIRAVPQPRNRLERMVRTVGHVYRMALAEDADVYHFHDPELLPVGFLLQRRGKPVIYDMHEDNVTAIRQKSYLPRPVRPLLASLLDTVEKRLSRSFHIVLAERYYARRYPGQTTVLNYPVRSSLPAVAREAPITSTIEGTAAWPRPSAGARPSERIRLLFTGKVARMRGALNHARIVTYLKNVEVHIVGYCDRHLADEMRQRAGDGRDRLHIDGEGVYVPYDRILGYYTQGGWTAGLALFMPNPHDMEKELTKLFEYMGVGIPIICSDFPVWRALIEETGTGLCVDPLDPKSIADAVEYLVAHPEEAERMREKGRLAVREKYNWDLEAHKLLSLYERSLQTQHG